MLWKHLLLDQPKTDTKKVCGNFSSFRLAKNAFIPPSEEAESCNGNIMFTTN